MAPPSAQPPSSALKAGTPVQTLKGVGPRTLARLERLGLHTLEDLLFHLPLRYQDRTHITPLGALQPGVEAVIEATIALADVTRQGRRALLCRVQDGTGALTLRFFHFSAAQQSLFKSGTRLRCFGEVRNGPQTLEMIHPECKVLEPDSAPLEARLTAFYPSTEGLPQATLRGLLEQALDWLAAADAAPTPLPDYLPEPVRQRLHLPALTAALQLVHCPPPALADVITSSRHPARRRLAFEELLAHQLSLRQLRAQLQQNRAPALNPPGQLVTQFLASLPFTLTCAQQRVLQEIHADLHLARPMLRLVQGDVGSGKTVVAAAAALRAVEAGWQAAVMAPTELLSEQHWRNFSHWLTPLGLRVGWLTGSRKGKERQATLADLASGALQVAVGTHALFQQDVNFAQLGLVIIDEQHRFGVHQRLALREKGRSTGQQPHQLIMTATPIPRTLAMTAYADLDTSLIDELPAGRQPVTTVALPDGRRLEVIERIRLACQQGRQAYWVCTLIEESEVLECQAAADTAAQLAEALSDLRVALVHGRLKPAEKETTMAAFKAGQIDLLVATTVIEVGVDVPNASLMIIENPERLGLAQLHQLRGRVGRGTAASSCVLLYRPPLSYPARERLAILRASNDGFEIARRDLELRGPGEVLGTRQTGMMQFRIADIGRDADLLDDIQRTADTLLHDYPDHAEALIRRWIGAGARYGEV